MREKFSTQTREPVAGGSLLYYNRAMFDEAGVPYPDQNTDWNKFLELAQKVMRKSPDGRILRYGMVWPGFYMDESLWYMILWQYGGEVVRSEGDAYVLGREPYLDVNVQALQFFIDLSNKHQISPTSYELEQLRGVDLFKEGRAAMRLSGSWEPFVFRERPEFRWGYAPLPFLKKRVTCNDGNPLVIPAGCKHPREAFEVAKYLCRGAYQKVVAETGRAIPAEIAVAESDLFRKSLAVDRSLMLQVAADGRRRAWKGKLSMYQLEIHEIEKRNVELAFLGRMSVRECILRIQSEVDNLLLRAG